MIYGLSNVTVTFGPRRELRPRVPAEPGDFARASLEVRGWRLVDAEQAQRAAPDRVRIPPAELRYRGLRPGDRIKVVARRPGLPDDVLWCWVGAVQHGDEPKLTVWVDDPPLACDGHGLAWGDELTVHPREVLAVETNAGNAAQDFGPWPVMNA